MKKDKILILYHSGSGSTKAIAEILLAQLSKLRFSATMVSIRFPFPYEILQNYDSLIFGFPTHHHSPSRSIREFFKAMPPSTSKQEVFAYNTYGESSGNSMRQFIQMSAQKNLQVGMSLEVKSPAVDQVLFARDPAPFLAFDPLVRVRVEGFVSEIEKRLAEPGQIDPLPPRRWKSTLYGIKQAFLKKKYNRLKHSLRLQKDKCGNCQSCVENCIRGGWLPGDEVPSFNSENCEFCLGCVHHCPTGAITFPGESSDRPRLSRMNYIQFKHEILD